MKKDRNVIIIAGLLVVIMLAIVAFSNNTPRQQPVAYHSIEIKSGDTLWDISQRYKPSFISTKEFVRDIKELNNISDKIRSGNFIIIPIYDEIYTTE